MAKKAKTKWTVNRGPGYVQMSANVKLSKKQEKAWTGPERSPEELERVRECEETRRRKWTESADLLVCIPMLNRDYGITVDMTDTHQPIFQKGHLKLVVPRTRLFIDGLGNIIKLLETVSVVEGESNAGLPENLFADYVSELLFNNYSGRRTLKYKGGEKKA